MCRTVLHILCHIVAIELALFPTTVRSERALGQTSSAVEV